MPFELPNSLGPFSVDKQGRIAPRDSAEMPNFLFQWRERRVAARLMGRDGDGSLMLSAQLGRVPSSAGPDPASNDRPANDRPANDRSGNDRRVASFTTLRTLLDHLPADWRVRLLPDHQVRLEAEILLPWPATAVDLMTQLTNFLLALAPYLDLLEEEDTLDYTAPRPATALEPARMAHG